MQFSQPSKISKKDADIIPVAEPASIQEFDQYISTLDFGPGKRDQAGYLAFLRAGSLGVEPNVAIAKVKSQITVTGGGYNPSKLTNQLRRAYDYVGSETSGVRTPLKPIKATFSPEKRAKVASKVTGVNAEWLRAHSSIPVTGVTSAQFLDHLYQPAERIVVFTDYQSQGQCIYEVGAAGNPPIPKEGSDGVWFLVNPVDGQFHPNPRQDNKESRRSEESVTSWRYLILENDVANQNEWLSCIVQLPLKIVAIYTSGGKSIHALVRLDATSKADWNAQSDRIKPIVVTLGADPSALTAVRLSRLPCRLRGKHHQELLHLNPKASGQAIITDTKSKV